MQALNSLIYFFVFSCVLKARHSWESGSLGESLNQGFVDLSKYFFFGKGEIVHIVAIALTLTVLRIVVEKTLLKVN